jgi:hypothetical protein
LTVEVAMRVGQPHELVIAMVLVQPGRKQFMQAVPVDVTVGQVRACSGVVVVGGGGGGGAWVVVVVLVVVVVVVVVVRVVVVVVGGGGGGGGSFVVVVDLVVVVCERHVSQRKEHTSDLSKRRYRTVLMLVSPTVVDGGGCPGGPFGIETVALLALEIVMGVSVMGS